MTRMTTLICGLVAAWWLGGHGVAAQRGELPRGLSKAIESARTKAASELVSLARRSESAKAYGAARADLKRALAIAPTHKKARTRFSAIEKKEPAPRRGFEKALQSRRRAAYKKAAKRLGTVAKKLHKAGHRAQYEALAQLVHSQLGADSLSAGFGAAWFAPFRAWVHPADLKRLKSGDVFHDGKWHSKKEQVALNKAHATWENPWVIDDGVHQLRTTLPLRQAKHLLGHIGAFRAFLLASFAGEWDLRAPKGLLPVIVTETQADLADRMKNEVGARGGGMPGGQMQGAAFYLQTNSALNPCFVTLEPQAANGGAHKVKVDEIYIPLQHELTHQIAFEYSKFDYDRTRHIESQFWCVEGLANLFEYYVPDGQAWRLSRPKLIPMGDAFIEGGFAWTKANRSRIPPLETLFAFSKQEFSTVENYHMSSLVTHFLLDGLDRRYRRAFVRLLDAVHRVKDTPKILDECFQGVDRAKMQKEWEAFIATVSIDK